MDYFTAKYPAEGIDKDLLIKGYFGKLAEISGFMAEMPMENGVYSPAEIERINVFFSEINHPALNAKDYLLTACSAKAAKCRNSAPTASTPQSTVFSGIRREAMLPDRNILKTAKTILKIQDKLHPLLFGEDGFMLEETRQELLKKANFYIAKVLRTIQDIQVSDIILVGSSASYFYTSASDFDLKIILNLSHNRAIGSNVKKFLKILNNTFYRNNVRLRLYDHFIDIKFDEDDNL